MMAQRTAAWRRARLGKVTASRIADVITKTRNGYSAARGALAAQIVCERLTGRPSESFVSAAMQWGIDQEARARRRYEFERDVEVHLVGFLEHPALAFCGTSPDGLVGDDGLVEIKCPSTQTHLDTLVGEPPPLKHLAQAQWQMAVVGASWCDLVSYDPRLPFELQFFARRIYRDEAIIAGLEAEVRVFLGEVEASLAKLLAAAERSGARVELAA